MSAPVITLSLTPPDIDREQVLRFMGQPSDAPDEVLSVLDECIAEARECFVYKVCFAQMPVSAGQDTVDMTFATVHSHNLASRLVGCRSAVIFGSTVGLGIDRLINKYSRAMPIKALCMQAIGAERIEALCDAFCEQLKKEGRVIRARYSPGYGDLDLSFQREIFKLLDCPRRIGLTLSESLLMLPTKSVSAIVGVE